MRVYIDDVEWLWIALNVLTFVLTLYARRQARIDQRAVQGINGKAREVSAAGGVRRETVRVGLQLGLLSLVWWSGGLTSDRDVTLNPFVVTLFAIAIGMFVNSALDLRDRREVMRILDKAER